MTRPSHAGDQPVLLLSANSVWNVLNYRANLLRALRAEGYRLVVAAPVSAETAALEALGVEFAPLPMRPTGTSPVEDALLLARYVALMRRLRPLAYLGFTAKPNVYGSLAGRICGVPALANLTGLGTAFIHGRPLERLLSSLYRLALRGAEAVFFHNSDDRDLFVGRRLVRQYQAVVLPGSGVDLKQFAPQPLPGRGDALTFLFVGRLLWEKGVGEFAEAARLVKQTQPNARFQLVGAWGDDKRAVPRELVEDWVREGRLEHLPTCEDIRPLIAGADCVILPSYREGLPRVLLEAAAMGRPAIASDVPGCRHAVVDGVTGFLCKARSGAATSEAVRRLIDLSERERQAMGTRARAHAEEHFGDERVSAAYLSVLSRVAARARRS